MANPLEIPNPFNSFGFFIQDFAASGTGDLPMLSFVVGFRRDLGDTGKQGACFFLPATPDVVISSRQRSRLIKRSTQIAVLASTDSWYLRDLQRAAGHPDQITAMAYSQLAAWLCTADSQVLAKDCPLNDYDALLVRTMPAASLEQVVFRMNALAQLESNGLVVVNPARSLEVAIDRFQNTRDAGLPKCSPRHESFRNTGW